MNRADLTAGIIRLEQLSMVARDAAGELRKQLASDAEAEWDEHKTAPTWRMDAATVSLPITHDAIAVNNPDALVGWVATHRPGEVEAVRRVRESYLSWLRGNLIAAADEDGRPVVKHPDTGEVVPGVTWIPGGQPGALSIRANAAAKREYRELAERQLKALTAEDGGE